MKPPEFKSGNRWFVSALNTVVSYCRSHGVNPAGRAGWSQTADGWMPPKTGGLGAASEYPWDLTVSDGDAGEVTITHGSILTGSDQIGAELTLSNPDATLSVSNGSYIAIKITDDDPADYEITAVPSWPEADGYTVSYTGTVGGEDFAFTARHYPLWKIQSTQVSGATPINASLYAIRLAPFENLQVQQGIYRTPDGEFVQLPEFVISHKSA